MRETPDRNTTAVVKSLHNGASLKPLSSLRQGSEPDGLERYAYRSFDRQWILSDNRLSDRPRPPLWDVRGPDQIYVTTLTSTKLGAGPAVTATTYVPDLDHFRGSYGAKNVMPLYRDRGAKNPNVTNGLLEVIAEALGAEVEPGHLLAYVYGLTGTAAFTDRFTDELGEAAGPVRIPITADAELFDEVVAVGEELLWLHTWGERFADGQDLPSPTAKEITPVSGAYPEKFKWDAGSQTLTVGSGSFGPVDREVWEFEVSGLKVLQSWLGYRMKAGKGKKSSPLDDIRPERWTFTPELLTLLAILEQTVALTPSAAELLDRVVAGDLIDPATLPIPSDAERKAPKA